MYIPTFIDVESSGLHTNSYPIEIAWLNTKGEYDKFFINPNTVESWDFWDSYAEEEIHHISRHCLDKNGIAVNEAAQRLNDKLSGKTLLSDAESFDSFWIDKLFLASGIKRNFSIMPLNVYLMNKTIEDINAYTKRYKEYPTAHRALTDCVRNLRAGIDTGLWSYSGDESILKLQKDAR